jgi:hypothetical protein
MVSCVGQMSDIVTCQQHLHASAGNAMEISIQFAFHAALQDMPAAEWSSTAVLKLLSAVATPLRLQQLAAPVVASKALPNVAVVAIERVASACALHLTSQGNIAKDFTVNQLIDVLRSLSAVFRCSGAVLTPLPDPCYHLLVLIASELPAHIQTLASHVAMGTVGMKHYKRREIISFDTIYPVLSQSTFNWQFARFADYTHSVVLCLAALQVRHDAILDVICFHATTHVWVYSTEQLAEMVDALLSLSYVHELADASNSAETDEGQAFANAASLAIMADMESVPLAVRPRLMPVVSTRARHVNDAVIHLNAGPLSLWILDDFEE